MGRQTPRGRTLEPAGRFSKIGSEGKTISVQLVETLPDRRPKLKRLVLNGTAVLLLLLASSCLLPSFLLSFSVRPSLLLRRFLCCCPRRRTIHPPPLPSLYPVRQSNVPLYSYLPSCSLRRHPRQGDYVGFGNLIYPSRLYVNAFSR